MVLKLSKKLILQCVIIFVMGAISGVLSSIAYNYNFIEITEGDGSLFNQIIGVNPDHQTFYGVLPGVVFGAAVSIISWCYRKDNFGKLKRVLAISSVCTISFIIARVGVASFIVCHIGGAAPGHTDIDMAKIYRETYGFSGFISTLIMMLMLNFFIEAYSWKWIVVSSILGGVAAAAFVKFTVLPILGPDEGTVLFIGWQSIMLVAVGIPLLQCRYIRNES